MENKEFEVLMHKYIEETISEEEFVQLKAYDAFASQRKLLEAASGFSAPALDIEKSYEEFMAKAPQKDGEWLRRPTMKRYYWGIGIAASLLLCVLLLGIYRFMDSSRTFATGHGEQLTVFLPDSSEVLMNAGSSLEFSEKKWAKERRVHLVGEAFFKVRKGEKFSVVTEEGIVRVLGTQFTVSQYHQFLEVHCFGGRVSVERKGIEKTLSKGEAIRQIRDDTIETWSFEQKIPSWKNFESSFRDTPLSYVLEAIAKIYGVEFVVKNVDVHKRFSGSFSNKDIDVALEVISNAMDLDYSKENNKVVLRKK